MSEETGAVRSADANHLDFASLPLVGLIGVARTANEGGTKYGRYNYMRGFPVHDLLNHSIRHVVMFLLGDRSEPHLEHAAWGLLAAIQSYTLDPHLSAPHTLSPGATLGPAMLELLSEDEKALSVLRKEGKFEASGQWSLRDVPEINTILGQREASTGVQGAACGDIVVTREPETVACEADCFPGPMIATSHAKLVDRKNHPERTP